MEIEGMIPKLTRLLFSSIRTGAEWSTEVFVSYCEMVVRALAHTILAIIVADILIQASIRFDINALLILGVAIGSGGLLYLAIVSLPGRMAAEKFSQLSVIAKEEIQKLSNMAFVIIVTLFYLGIDQGQQHPTLLKVFLGIMTVLFVIAILPGESRLITFFKKRFQVLVLIPVIIMTIFAAMPEAIANRIIYGHGMERITGTVAEEIPYHLDDQDQIIDDLTNQPMIFFDQIAAKDSDQPRPLIGWTQDQKGQHHLYRWFEGQKNYNRIGREIKPVTTDKLDDITVETKRVLEQKIADEKKIADEQEAIADAEAAKLKAEREQKMKAQRDADELARKRQAEKDEAERIAREAEEERRRLASQPISVSSTILAPTDQSQEIVVVKPNEQFMYRGAVIQPDRSAIALDIIDVKPASEKNKYELTLQPQMLMSAGQNYDISRQTELIQLIVKKDSSRSIWKILGGAGAGALVGAIADGRKGAAEGLAVGVAAGTVYAMASRGYKFQLTVGDTMPPIIIRPVL